MQNKVAYNNSQHLVVQIYEVYLPTGYIVGRDKRNNPYHIDITSFESIASIPDVGEQWVIQRIGNNWKARYRLENGNEKVSILQLRPGDKRIQAKRLHFSLDDGVYINGYLFGPKFSIYNEIPTGEINDVNTDFTTAYNFIENSLRVYHNGLRTVDYTITTNVGFKMNSAPATNDTLIIDYEYTTNESLYEDLI